MRKSVVVLFAVLFTAATILPAMAAVDKTAADAQALFEKKCSACHGSDRAKGKKKTARDWESTVMRMKEKKNANISDDEAKAITDYLAKNYGAK
jgi:mono/diheme cytochrome c family protein